jgi:biotin transport system substrate-specific component
MELTKNISQTKLIKTVLAIILGSIALTISAKIKIPFYPCSNDYANVCGFVFRC